LTKGSEGSKVLYFSVNENPAEVLNVKLRPKPKLRKTEFEFDLNTIEVKGRGSIGNILSRNLVAKITKGSAGKVITSTATPEIKAKLPPAISSKSNVGKLAEGNQAKQKTTDKKMQEVLPAKKKVEIKSGQKKSQPVKDEAPVTLEWDFTEKEKVQKDRTRILTELEKKAEAKKKAQLKMDM
jgi:hypothetical protein